MSLAVKNTRRCCAHGGPKICYVLKLWTVIKKNAPVHSGHYHAVRIWFISYCLSHIFLAYRGNIQYLPDCICIATITDRMSDERLCGQTVAAVRVMLIWQLIYSSSELDPDHQQPWQHPWALARSANAFIEYWPRCVDTPLLVFRRVTLAPAYPSTVADRQTYRWAADLTCRSAVSSVDITTVAVDWCSGTTRGFGL